MLRPPLAPPAASSALFLALFFEQSVRALRRNAVRSALAAVGIMIGIAAVVCVVAIGKAGSQRAEDQLRNLGDNLVWAEAGSRAPNGVRSGSHGATSLTMQDAAAIASEVPGIKSVSPNVDGTIQLVYGNKNWRTRYRGISPEYFDIKRWEIAEGAFFSAEDVRRTSSVVLLGQTTREQVFGSEDPIGKTVRIGTQLFVVVGVLAPKGQSATGQDQDDTVLLPWTAAMKKIRGKGIEWLDDILCSATTPQGVGAAAAGIAALLRQRHHIKEGAEDDFNIRRPDELIKAQIETSHTLEVLLLSVASISLLVGGIGIMNLMLVSVAERTAEIGLRLAVGATEGAVQAQFLGEAVVLSFFGGVLGILLGVAGTMALARGLGWNIGVPAQALVIAPLFAVGTGVFFGFYPARRAARLDPITALRRE